MRLSMRASRPFVLLLPWLVPALVSAAPPATPAAPPASARAAPAPAKAVEATLAPPAADASSPITLPFTKTTLANGMTLIVHEDHAFPVAVVNLAVKVGSRFEQPHRTGFAHLFEHLMFMGTVRAPTKMYDAWMEAVGGANNAMTSEDRTVYYDVVPSAALDLALWLEADRLRDLGPLMNAEKLRAQRDVVRNERRQSIENVPYGLVELRIPELLWPEGHPYHHPVIGSHEDLEAATVDDVKQFFATWYDPANTSLVIAGDVKPDEVTASAQRDFGTIPTRGKPNDPAAEHAPASLPPIASPVRETIEDEVELPKVIMAWRTPKHFDPGDAELDLLATVLAGGKASRLYKALVYEQKLAQEVSAYQASGTLGSHFQLEVLARPRVTLDMLEKAIDAELAKVRAAEITDGELTRVKNQYETDFVTRLEQVERRAFLLNDYETEVGDPGYAARDLERYRRATATELRRVANEQLRADARVVLRVVPRNAGAPAASTNGGAGASGAKPGAAGGAK